MDDRNRGVVLVDEPPLAPVVVRYDRVSCGPDMPTGSLKRRGQPRRWAGTVTADRGKAIRMDEHSTRVAELLHEAAETHHQVFRITEGADDDWASWYSEWLVTLSELPELLGAKVVRSELTYLLVRLDNEYVDRRPDQRWEDYYARELVRHFGPS